ncbi:hypothetical protein EON83_19915 [bacterium]|nr:MAG: hypothetical protein EON83_19915 [bacterium]
MSNKYDEIMQQLGAKPINGRKTLLSDTQLDKMEADLGHPLPADYREFIRCYGGYQLPDGGGFPVKPNVDNKRRAYIETICGWQPDLATTKDDYYGYYLDSDMSWDFYPDSGVELVRSYPPDTETITWPKELIVIGEDGGANSICLAISGLRPGAVFCWRTSGNVYLAADSFDEFMHSLSLED